jgi:predicted nucleic acid-binding protein
MAEFWSVATRPAEKNGLGLSLPQADWYVSRLEAILTLLNDTPAMHREWRSLVVAHAVAGPRVYDARLVAAMTVYGITSILTFSGDDFKRYPGVHVIHPQAVSGQTP